MYKHFPKKQLLVSYIYKNILTPKHMYRTPKGQEALNCGGFEKYKSARQKTKTMFRESQTQAYKKFHNYLWTKDGNKIT